MATTTTSKPVEIEIAAAIYDGWSRALEVQAETDYHPRTEVSPAGRRMSARHTLSSLQQFAGDQVQMVEVGVTPETWPKYAMLACGETVILRDPDEEQPGDYSAQLLHDVIRNAERLTGIPAE